MKTLNFSSQSIVRLLVFTFVFLMSCHRQSSEKQEVASSSNYEESLIEANKKAVKTEEQQINDFVKRVKWKMLDTGTGLRYNIYETGNGKPAELGKIAELEYNVSLISGDIVYSSKTTGNKVFTIGKGGVESGLEEGILLLHEGDHAKFIIPSHLAFGLMGDQNKIPPKTTLVYDVKLIKIK